MLGRSIYVGDRLKANLSALTSVSLFTAILGLILIGVNVLFHHPVELTRVLMSVVTFLAGASCAWISYYRKDRNAAVMIPTLFCCVVFSVYAITGYAEGTGILWSLLLPIGMCYFVGVRHGILLSAWHSLLYAVLFYTPLGNNMRQYYNDAFMERFPLMYFALSVFTAVAMIQYHRIALFEIDYTDRLNEEVRRQTAVAEERSRRIEQMSFQTIQTLANAIDAKDPYTKGHSTRVSQYSVRLASALGWDEERINQLRYSALLHDIGKIGVPDSILNKPRRLTEIEYDIIKSHTTIGGDILRDRTVISCAEDVARCHHERFDGRGYPRGLKGPDLSEEARIVAIADSFDAMSSTRVYRKSCSREYILNELKNGRGKQFDPRFTDVFISLWEQGQLEEIINHTQEADSDSETTSVLLQEVIESFTAPNPADSLDVITGLPDRTFGEAEIARRMKEQPGCLVFLDVDNLKKVNDVSGHQAGDLTLRLMGETLREEPEDNFSCRLGGDEFLLFLPDVSMESAESRVRGILVRFLQKKNADPKTSLASLSAGMAMCSPSDSYSSVYSKADKALYHVKQNGRNNCCFFQEQPAPNQGEPADINRLILSIRNTGSYDGAMNVEYRQFAKMYEFVSKLEERFHQSCMFLMITLEASGKQIPPMEQTEEAMFCMEQAIRQNIRNVDILTRYSRQQFLVILLGTDSEGARIAADRIFRGYFKMSGTSFFSPVYTLADIKGEAEPSLPA